MSGSNPYDCTKPGNLFVGYERELAAIVSGLQQGKSYDLRGGRQCGKTSLLKQIEQSIQEKQGDLSCRLLPRFIDMQEVVPKSPADFFEALEAAITSGIDIEPWERSGGNHDYRSFLKRLSEAASPLERAYGTNWTVVLLLDELDAAARKMKSDECFQNLRSLLSSSAFKSRIVVVGSAAGGMDRLIDDGGGSPFNVLHREYTRCLSRAEVQALIQAGFADSLNGEVEEWLFQHSGGHAFILQALLSYLWDRREESLPVAQCLQRAGRRFIKDRCVVLQGWVQDIGPQGVSVYEELLRAPGLALTEPVLRARVAKDTGFKIDEVLSALAFHGLVDDTQEVVRISGELFRTWYVSGRGQPAVLSPQATPRAAVGPTRVFVIHGRHKGIHDALFEFLHALGLSPLDWSNVVDMTGLGTPSALDVLDKAFEETFAVLVLFTPDDEARLLARHLDEYDEDHERELRCQPRANVLIEAGMALSKFREKTLFVQVGKIRPVSDLAGLQFIRMDNSYEARSALKARLENARLAVDPSSRAWLTAGDFTP